MRQITHSRTATRIVRSLAAIAALALLSARDASAAFYVCSGGDWVCLNNAVTLANITLEADTILLDGSTYSMQAWQTCRSTTLGCDALGPITGRLTIIGSGRDVTIIQPDPTVPPMRVFDIAPGALVTLQDLTIRGVHSRGRPWDPTYGGLGVLNAGQLTLEDVAIRDNELDDGGAGAGIRNESTGFITIANSIVSGNSEAAINQIAVLGGAGIWNDGGLEIFSSSITGNVTRPMRGIGAGLVNSGTAIIHNSTISGNSAADAAGGGIYAAGSLTIESSAITGNTGAGFVDEPVGGGGIFVAGSVSINNSTIAGNRVALDAPWGAGVRVAAGGSLLLNGSTVADNLASGAGGERGGGIRNDGTAQIRNSIIARNRADDGFDPGFGPDCYGTLTSLGHNIIGNPTDCRWTPLASDHIGDAGLGTFADDGTPGHGSIPLLSTSIAIDGADPATSSALDQLGRSIVDGNVDGTAVRDTGAVEFKTPVVNALVVLNTSKQSYNATPVKYGPGGTLKIGATLTNVGSQPIYAPFLVLRTVDEGVWLLSADQSPGSVGSKQTPNVGADGVLMPGERVVLTIVFGLPTSRRPAFAFDVLGGAGATSP